MKIHFIAIGGSAMHNLAIALHENHYIITGSDDEIFEPSLSRLKEKGLLPEQYGWFPEKIAGDLDMVILGMHARSDNPELLRAKEMGLKIYSYPEFLYEHARNKTRVVIGGSHGKTTITAMIMHVLKYHGKSFDYMVGAGIKGFDVMVRLSEDAGLMILEGDEYLTSPIDRRPKFHLYKPHIGLISGIAWDHINVFPDKDNYVLQFKRFAELIRPGGTLVFCEEDKEVFNIAEGLEDDIKKIGYRLPEYKIKDGDCYLRVKDKEIPLKVFGKHNLLNIEGARNICNEIGVNDELFYQAIVSFPGAGKRLELLDSNDDTAMFMDFAHSPSKLAATAEAMKELYPDRELVACIELHTYSSLSNQFLKNYRGTLNSADVPIVYFNPDAIKLKRLPLITADMIREGFENDKLLVFSDIKSFMNKLDGINWSGKNLLLMSSGNFDNVSFDDLKEKMFNTQSSRDE